MPDIGGNSTNIAQFGPESEGGAFVTEPFELYGMHFDGSKIGSWSGRHGMVAPGSVTAERKRAVQGERLTVVPRRARYADPQDDMP